MAFEIISVETRTARMIQWFSGICTSITDFLVGSKIRSKFESVAVEMEAQDLSFYQTAKKAITAGMYHAFDFNVLPAVVATGVVTFEVETALASNVVIASGTMVATRVDGGVAEKLYTTTENCTLVNGTTSVVCPIQCTVAGTIGNTASGTITVLKTGITGIDSVNNYAYIRSGRDEEAADARKIRFQAYIPTLRRGTESAVIYGATTAALYDIDGNVIEQVQTAILDKALSVVIEGVSVPTLGYMHCHVYNGSTGASANLCAKAQEIIDGYIDVDGNKVVGYKAAGEVIDVLAAELITVAMGVTVSPLVNSDKVALKTNVEAAIDAYVSGLDIGEMLVKSELIERIQSVDGVYDCNVIALHRSSDVTIPASSDNVTPYQYEIITSGGVVAVTIL